MSKSRIWSQERLRQEDFLDHFIFLIAVVQGLTLLVNKAMNLCLWVDIISLSLLQFSNDTTIVSVDVLPCSRGFFITEEKKHEYELTNLLHYFEYFYKYIFYKIVWDNK